VKEQSDNKPLKTIDHHA